MFFPRGKALHENLATSYVLVDALIDDLCEGGFSGIVEIILHDADGHIIIERGKVAAALLKNNRENESSISVQELAARSRGERGRVSIYSYSTDVALALARRAASTPLYTQLSTDFADLGKMLSKLARERDREWLIEVMTKSGAQALIYLREADCLVITPEGNTDSADRVDLTGSPVLDDLLDECSRAGGTFDVYFRQAAIAPVEESEARATASLPPSDEEAASAAHEVLEVERYKVSQAATSQSLSITTGHTDKNPETVLPEPANPDVDQSTYKSDPPSWDEDEGGDTTTSVDEIKTSGSLVWPDQQAEDARKQGLTAHLFASANVPEIAGEAELIEVKRLMGEIARTIEESIRAVSQQSNFAMHLRAGQLRIADRYPFLDPFGNEFEYLAGEIVFVGKVKPDDFIAGLTEALRLALASAIQSSSQPARLRAIATEDLRVLGERYRSEFEEFGLDQSIERIIEA
jgi:hypothetical protein